MQISVSDLKNIMESIKQLATLPGDCHPESIYSKWMVRDRYRCSIGRINAAAQKIAHHPDYIENGDNCMAPLRAWCEILRTIPKNPRPRTEPKKAKRGRKRLL